MKFYLKDLLKLREEVPENLSQSLPALIRRGEEERFWSTEKIAFLDTSFLTACYYQHHLWAEIAALKAVDLGCAPVILPGVVSEVKHLDYTQRADKYGFLLFASWRPLGLSEEEVSINIAIPGGLEDKIRNMWMSVSPKYRRHRRAKQEAEESGTIPPELPKISGTDIKVIASALTRAMKGLETYVLTGDSDISSVINGFVYEKELLGQNCPLYVMHQQELQPEIFAHKKLQDIFALVTNSALTQIREAEQGSYVLFSRREEIVEGVRKSVGFKVIPTAINNADFFSAVIVDNVQFEGDLLETTRRSLKAVVRSKDWEFPIVYTQGRMIKGKADVLTDPSKTYKDVSVSACMGTLPDSQKLSKQELQALRHSLIRGGLQILIPWPWLRVDGDYMLRRMPALYQRLENLKTHAIQLAT